MLRRDYVTLLLDRPQSVSDLARALELTPREVADDLTHLERSLKGSAYRLVVTPARCRQCGFEFSPGKRTRPSKCPACRATRIAPPLVAVEEKQPGSAG